MRIIQLYYFCFILLIFHTSIRYAVSSEFESNGEIGTEFENADGLEKSDHGMKRVRREPTTTIPVNFKVKPTGNGKTNVKAQVGPAMMSHKVTKDGGSKTMIKHGDQVTLAQEKTGTGGVKTKGKFGAVKAKHEIKSDGTHKIGFTIGQRKFKIKLGNGRILSVSKAKKDENGLEKKWKGKMDNKNEISLDSKMNDKSYKLYNNPTYMAGHGTPEEIKLAQKRARHEKRQKDMDEESQRMTVDEDEGSRDQEDDDSSAGRRQTAYFTKK